MKSGGNAQGFTIIETLIFLGVSAVIMVSVLSLVGGSQNKAQFQQAVYDTDQQINDVVDNVSNGFYNKVGKINCTVTATGSIKIDDTVDTELGANKDCMFIGRVIRLGVENQADRMTVYDVAGVREIDGIQVTTLATAKPTLISPGTKPATFNFPDASEKKTLKGGFSATKMFYKDSSNIVHDIRGMAILSNFAQSSGGANLKPAAQPITVFAIESTTISQNSREFVDKANDQSNYISDLGTDGITVCFDSGTTDQHAIIKIGGTGQSNKTQLEIKDGKC